MEIFKRGYMNILSFTNETGSKHWRLQSIANYVNANTQHEWAVVPSSMWNGDILGADIVIAQMWRNPEGVETAKKQGAKVIYEADDIIIGVGGKDRKELMDLSKEATNQTIETIKACDLVTVTTESLAKHYRQFHNNVVVLPNYMDFNWWGKAWKSEKNTDEIRIGWAGSRSHREDLLLLVPVMKKILKKYPQTKFIYCGYGGMSSSSMSTAVGWGKDLFEELPRDRREFFIGVPLDYWAVKSKTLGLDIALAPLLDDEFNSGKSNIKWQEYSCNLTPGIYSDTVVYSNVKDGITGLKAKTEKDWMEAIEFYINHPKNAMKIAQNAFEDVLENWDLEKHYMDWIKTYGSI
jgi:glycosyltransferase involved in cell wall biosynthesis